MFGPSEAAEEDAFAGAVLPDADVSSFPEAV
jgi:hypothetical protein